MENKLRQITDTVHGTIYLSELEAAMISTPYFYRLHDIYQSSTVYTVYPCNRTKRYEHSLGTMSIASEMLFSAVSRAETSVQEDLFNELLERYRQIIALVVKGTVPCYYYKSYDDIKKLFRNKSLKGTSGEKEKANILEEITIKATEAGLFNDEALGNYQYYPMNFDLNAIPGKECGMGGTACGVADNAERWFTYRCILQAIRIVALFHDVGHPPFSHIIEAEMKNLFDEIVGCCKDEEELKCACSENDLDFGRVNIFQKCLKPYFDSKVECLDGMLYAKTPLKSGQSHERIGIKLLQLSIMQIVSECIQKALGSNLSAPNKAAYIIYYTTIAEFAIAIWSEKDTFFQSLHKLVDGTIDADRLDYVVRDSENSGVDWGVIPYKRIVNAARFCHPQNHPEFYAVAFPQKVADDLEDLLITRYKIYERINYHHRTIKSSMALRAAVHDLVMNYLSISQKDLCPNISTLWEALSTDIGEETIRIIQWNDSWLTTVLHDALINIYADGESSQYLKLKENLEEFLLGKKRYYPLLKRGVDNKKLLEEVFKKAGLSQEVLREKMQKEWEKFYKTSDEKVLAETILSSPNACAQDAIFRLKSMQRGYDSGDFYPLQAISFPVEEELEMLLESTLKKMTETTELADYRIYVNNGKRKDGLPNNEDPLNSIYLFNGKEYFPMDTEKTAKMHIDAVAKNIPYLYIYFSAKETASNIDQLGTQLFESIAETLAAQLKGKYEALFGPVQQ